MGAPTLDRATLGGGWDELDVDVCWYRGHTGYRRGASHHRRPFLADGAPLHRRDRETPGTPARRAGVPAQARAAAGPRSGGEPRARIGAARDGARDGRAYARAGGRRAPWQPLARSAGSALSRSAAYERLLRRRR